MSQEGRALALDAATLLGENDEEATRLFRAAAVVADNDPVVLVISAWHLFGLGYEDEAEKLLSAAIAGLGEQGSPELVSRAGLLGVRIAAAKGRNEDAERLLREGVEQFPDEPAWPHTLANFLFQNGRKPEALEAVRVGLSLHGDDQQLVDLEAQIADASR